VTTLDVAAPSLTVRSFRAIGTTATVVVADPCAADAAKLALASELHAVDEACSRFRDDSELAALHARAGVPVCVSPLLYEAIDVACRVARRTAGAVDPTVGNAVAALGYDCDLDEVIARRAPATPHVLGPVAGFGHVHLDPDARTVRIPRGVLLDLGSTAKALAADRAAARIAREIDGPALVSLGGDVAVGGPSLPGGWAVGIAHESSTPAAEVDQVVAIHRGGLASSAPGARRWMAGGRNLHHIVDPRTGDCADTSWTLVSATGDSCVDANMVTTAAMVWGDAELGRVASFGQAVRLVRPSGQVVYLNGWPAEDSP
jgi:FAD:protein FMN transferase